MEICTLTVPALVVTGLPSEDVLGTDSNGIFQAGTAGGDATVTDGSGLIVTKTSLYPWLSAYLPDTDAGSSWVEKGVIHAYTTTSGALTLGTVATVSTTVAVSVTMDVFAIAPTTMPFETMIIMSLKSSFAYNGAAYENTTLSSGHATFKIGQFSGWSTPAFTLDGTDVTVTVTGSTVENVDWAINYTAVYHPVPSA
jgi:hypothetical protein